MSIVSDLTVGLAVEDGRAAVEVDGFAVDDGRAAVEVDGLAVEDGRAAVEVDGFAVEDGRAAVEVVGLAVEDGRAAVEVVGLAVEDGRAAVEVVGFAVGLVVAAGFVVVCFEFLSAIKFSLKYLCVRVKIFHSFATITVPYIGYTAIYIISFAKLLCQCKKGVWNK